MSKSLAFLMITSFLSFLFCDSFGTLIFGRWSLLTNVILSAIAIITYYRLFSHLPNIHISPKIKEYRDAKTITESLFYSIRPSLNSSFFRSTISINYSHMDTASTWWSIIWDLFMAFWNWIRVLQNIFSKRCEYV
jgi:hypothetical protein